MERPQDPRTALTEWLASSAAANLPAYALIDMAALHRDAPLPHILRTLRAAEAVSVLEDARPSAQVAIPWLVALTGEQGSNNGKLLATTLEWALQGPCVTWLSSTLTATQLAQRLRRRTEAVLPQNQSILLRCYDPRVLPELHKVLHAEQARSYWALGHEWAYLDRAREMKAIALTSPLSTDAFCAPLDLDQGQFDALLDASEVDSVMPELAREAPDAFLALPPEERALFTKRCLRLANDWGLQSFAQRVMVGVLALKLGEDFHQKPAWAPWIAQLTQGKIDLIQAIEGATAE